MHYFFANIPQKAIIFISGTADFSRFFIGVCSGVGPEYFEALAMQLFKLCEVSTSFPLDVFWFKFIGQ